MSWEKERMKRISRIGEAYSWKCNQSFSKVFPAFSIAALRISTPASVTPKFLKSVSFYRWKWKNVGSHKEISGSKCFEWKIDGGICQKRRQSMLFIGKIAWKWKETNNKVSEKIRWRLDREELALARTSKTESQNNSMK